MTATQWLAQPPNPWPYADPTSTTHSDANPPQVGHLPANINIPWRQSAMTGDVTPLGADLTGGWITGSEAGTAHPRRPSSKGFTEVMGPRFKQSAPD